MSHQILAVHNKVKLIVAADEMIRQSGSRGLAGELGHNGTLAQCAVTHDNRIAAELIALDIDVLAVSKDVDVVIFDRGSIIQIKLAVDQDAVALGVRHVVGHRAAVQIQSADRIGDRDTTAVAAGLIATNGATIHIEVADTLFVGVHTDTAAVSNGGIAGNGAAVHIHITQRIDTAAGLGCSGRLITLDGASVDIQLTVVGHTARSRSGDQSVSLDGAFHRTVGVRTQRQGHLAGVLSAQDLHVIQFKRTVADVNVGAGSGIEDAVAQLQITAVADHVIVHRVGSRHVVGVDITVAAAGNIGHVAQTCAAHVVQGHAVDGHITGLILHTLIHRGVDVAVLDVHGAAIVVDGVITAVGQRHILYVHNGIRLVIQGRSAGIGHIRILDRHFLLVVDMISLAAAEHTIVDLSANTVFIVVKNALDGAVLHRDTIHEQFAVVGDSPQLSSRDGGVLDSDLAVVVHGIGSGTLDQGILAADVQLGVLFHLKAYSRRLDEMAAGNGCLSAAFNIQPVGAGILKGTAGNQCIAVANNSILLRIAQRTAFPFQLTAAANNNTIGTDVHHVHNGAVHRQSGTFINTENKVAVSDHGDLTGTHQGLVTVDLITLRYLDIFIDFNGSGGIFRQCLAQPVVALATAARCKDCHRANSSSHQQRDQHQPYRTLFLFCSCFCSRTYHFAHGFVLLSSLSLAVLNIFPASRTFFISRQRHFVRIILSYSQNIVKAFTALTIFFCIIPNFRRQICTYVTTADLECGQNMQTCVHRPECAGKPHTVVHVHRSNGALNNFSLSRSLFCYIKLET